jgi:hypothetical protein
LAFEFQIGWASIGGSQLLPRSSLHQVVDWITTVKELKGVLKAI